MKKRQEFSVKELRHAEFQRNGRKARTRLRKQEEAKAAQWRRASNRVLQRDRAAAAAEAAEAAEAALALLPPPEGEKKERKP